MKLLFIVGAPLSVWRGAEQFVDRLGAEMTQRGHEVTVVAPVSDCQKEVSWTKSRNIPYQYRFVKLPRFAYFFSAFPLNQDSMLFVKKADVTYLSFIDPLFLSLFSLKSKPTIVGLHGVTDMNGIGTKILKLFTTAWRSSIVIHALNREQTDFFLRRGMSVFHIPLAVPKNLFVDKMCVNDVFRIWFPSMELFKGTDRMLELARLFADRFPDIRFTVTGSGRMENMIRTANEKLGNIELKPKLNERELLKVYQSSNLFLCLSRSEAFSLAAAEAQVNGLPVVSTPNYGTRDMLFDEELGALCDYSLHEFSTIIGNYYQMWRNNREQYLKLKLNIAAKQRPRLSWDVMVDTLEERFVRVSMEHHSFAWSHHVAQTNINVPNADHFLRFLVQLFYRCQS